MEKVRILSIDPATKTGWKSPSGGGVFDFKLRSKESQGMKFVKFRSAMYDIIDGDRINLVVYEKPGGRFFNGVRSHANFEGVLLELCEESGIDYRDYSATEIKKFAKVTMLEKHNMVYKGQMKKEDMLESAILHFEFENVLDDNHADALWLYELAKSEIN